MPATAHDVVTRALKRIGVLAAGETADADTAQDALKTLNQMLAGWELHGIRLNPPTYILTDLMQVPDAHIEAITANLATTIAPEFGREVSAYLLKQATDGKAGMQAAYAVVPVLAADRAYTRRMAGDWRTW